MRDVLMLDIDGVLANNLHRLDFARMKMWSVFYRDEMVLKDTKITPGLNLAWSLAPSCDIFFVTGRSDVCRDATTEWLRQAGFSEEGVKYEGLYMRKNGDRSQSAVAKLPMIEDIIKKYPEGTNFYFVDDSPANILAAKKAFPQITTLVFNTGRFDQLKA